MGVLQFASKGRGKAATYSCYIASSGVPYLSDASTRLFGSCMYFHQEYINHEFDEELV